MKIVLLTKNSRAAFDRLVNHPLQSWEWGEFKASQGAVVRRFGIFQKNKLKGGFQVFFHRLPGTSFTVGYFPRGPLPTQSMIKKIFSVAKKEKALLVRFEPDLNWRYWQNNRGKLSPTPTRERKIALAKMGLRKAPRSVLDPYTFVLNLRLSEEKILANMHHKTRYNIRLARRKGVTVKEESNQTGLAIFIRLLFEETVKRQGFYLHNPEYFRKLWRILSPAGMVRILLASYKGDVLAAWMLFKWKDTLYYPYGASSSRLRQVMASNLICWEAIRLGKKLGCRYFDLWGGLGPQADPSHPWYGFHRFKLGYGGDLVEKVGSWDLVVNPYLYPVYNTAEKLRWFCLHRLRRLFRRP